MAEHAVSFKLPEKLALEKNVVTDVRSNGSKLGTVLVSQGNIEWVPTYHSVRKRRLSWEKFAELMATQGKTKRIN